MSRGSMNPGFDQRIADWLEDDPDDAPDAVLATVLAAFPSIPQRRAMRVPWRFFPMNRAAQLGAAAAILVVAGLILFRPGPADVGAAPSDSPSSMPTASPSASAPTPTTRPSPSPFQLSAGGSAQDLAAGTYRVDGFAVPVTLTLTAGWVSNGFKPHDLVLHNDATNAFLALVVMDGVYKDPCHPAATPTPLRPGVDGLVSGLSAMKGFTITNRKAATVGGAPGSSFILSNKIDLARDQCSRSDVVWIGRDADGAPVLETPGGADPLWVVDVSGTTLLIGGPSAAVDAITFGSTTP